jgi:hypothetical protein
MAEVDMGNLVNNPEVDMGNLVNNPEVDMGNLVNNPEEDPSHQGSTNPYGSTRKNSCVRLESAFPVLGT